MSANSDYAIVISGRYMELKYKMSKEQAIIETMNFAFPTIVTSGTMLAIAGILIGQMSSDGAICGIGQCLGQMCIRDRVTITLDGGQSFTASLLNSTAYNIGDRACFVIQDNKGENIVLKAVTMQATALETAMINKSLKAAGIMPTLRNREMVLELMRNGMPIGRDALLDMVKELSSHSNAEIEMCIRDRCLE